MVRTRLTSVGKLFAGLLGLFYVASVTSQSGLLLLFIGLIGCCFLVNWSFSRRNVRNLKVIAPKRVEIVEGEPSKEPWRVENNSRKHAEYLDIFHQAGLLFRFPTVKAGDAVMVVPKAVYDTRGVYPNSEVTVSSAAPYGLLRASRKLQLDGEVIVLPRVYETAVPAGAGLEQVSGGRFRGKRRVSNGTNFAGVRAWEAGDALRQVHWKSTARRGELMVKTFEEELGGRISLILDCANGTPTIIDNAVRACASLGTAALQQGHHLELIDSAAEPLRLAPFSDEGELLVRLACYQATADLPLDYERLWRKATTAIVGVTWRESWRELISAARLRNRRVYVYLPEGQGIPSDVDAEIASFGRAQIKSPEHSPA